jgi:hypothetical protein
MNLSFLQSGANLNPEKIYMRSNNISGLMCALNFFKKRFIDRLILIKVGLEMIHTAYIKWQAKVYLELYRTIMAS